MRCFASLQLINPFDPADFEIFLSAVLRYSVASERALTGVDINRGGISRDLSGSSGSVETRPARRNECHSLQTRSVPGFKRKSILIHRGRGRLTRA